MTGLMSAIPGLAMHKTTVPDPPPPPAFDREKADSLMREAISLLCSFYPVGAMEWLRENRPDAVKHLEESMAEIDAAVLAEDIKAVTAALERYVKFHQRAFELFEQRPPVIEVQEALL